MEKIQFKLVYSFAITFILGSIIGTILLYYYNDRTLLKENQSQIAPSDALPVFLNSFQTVAWSDVTLNDTLRRQLRYTPFVSAVARVREAVVSVSVTQVRYYQYPIDPFFEMFFPELGQRQIVPYSISSMGSGFIVDPEGYVITNAHVVQDAKDIYINFPDSRQFPGKLVGLDNSADIAIIKIEGDNLPVAPLGDSDDLMIGEYAIAIGNPFGYILAETGPSVTCGWISAVNRNIKFDRENKYYKRMIQTNADINQGNSGGPLLNILGEVIGVNTFILTQGNSGSIGLGFALPINKAKKVMQEIRRYGRVRNFYTGISINDISPMVAEYLNLKQPGGAIITNVETGSPADEAGLKRRDVIIGVNNKRMKNSEEILDEFSDAQVGDRVAFKIIREKNEISISMKLKENPQPRKNYY